MTAETRTLFAVGDEKQSIFGFQGAAPKEFGVNRTYFLGLAQTGRLSLRGRPSAYFAPRRR